MKLFETLMHKLNDFKNWLLHTSIFVKGTLVVVIALAAWFGLPKLIGGSKSSAISYQTTAASTGTIVVTVTESGAVSSANSGSVTTQASGVVNKILVQNGETVKTGQAIAQFDLDQTSLQKYQQALASYQGAKNNLANAQAQAYTLQSAMFVANQKFLTGVIAAGTPTYDPTYVEQNATWLASEQQYITQQSVITAAQTSVNAAAAALQAVSPTVTAPISGTVTGLSLQIGSVLSSVTNSSGGSTDQKIASIQTSAAPTVTVQLTQVDVPNIKVGDKATLTFDAFAGKTYTGKVVSIDTIGAVSSGVTTYPAVIQLDDTGVTNIFSNMTVTANIITASKDNVIMVPNAAISTNSNGEEVVRIMKNGTPTTTIVTTGLASATQTEILTGVADGDLVVTGTTGGTAAASNVSSTTSVFSTLTGGNRGFGGGGGGAVRAPTGAARPAGG